MAEVEDPARSEPARARVGSRRADAGLLSLAGSFSLGPGPSFDPDGVRGYPIDMRVKARASHWAADRDPAETLFVDHTQFGLACYEHWLALQDERWLEAALDRGHYLLSTQDPDGAWRHRGPLHHTFDLRPGWVSAMAQGEAASLLVRLYRETGDEQLAEAALRALAPLHRPVADGGVRAELGGGPWFEEYPTRPASCVLNGEIFALWGVRDVAVGLSDDAAAELFTQGLEVLVASLPLFDAGWWSLYCLGALPVRNLASSFYHSLHVNQLEVMHRITARPELIGTARRWRAYASRRTATPRVTAHKVLFRLLVPRNQLIAQPVARFWARHA